MKTLLAAVMLLALAACAAPSAPEEATPAATPAALKATSPPSTPVSDSVKAAAASDPVACAALNGTIRPVCRRQLPACVIAYRDARKTCANDADCEGKCILKNGAPNDPNATVTGQCQSNSNPCGCRTEVDGGKVLRSICVD